MNYYEVAILKSPLNNLTYQSSQPIKIGTKVLVKLGKIKKSLEAVIIKEVKKPPFNCIDIENITNEYYSERMIQISTFMATYYICSLGEALSPYIPFSKDLEEDFQEKKFFCDIKLTEEQKKAYEFLMKKKQALLFANTGSGKTEIYIKIIEQYLNKNKQAVLLMPEISLTPQMQKRLEKVFGSSVEIWHSKINKRKKREIIKGLLKGDVRLIAGARSSLFLPFKKLGVIVVDEEHDESYKSDSKPKANVKDLSLYISKKYNLQLILGSATPCLSSFKKTPFYRLKQSFFTSKKYISFDNSSNNLSPTILHKIEKSLKNNHQVIIFLPTRANFKYQICSNCGKSIECPYCSVSMSLHKNDLALKCHYCGYTQQIPNNCPSCNNGIIHNLRIGTAQIEEELNNCFNNVVIKRFDRDEIKTDTKLRTILNDFNKNKIDILVGTQMLSKGHDYHNVKLAVVLGIDSVLNMNSYKAREKALSLLIQIAGRSGRKGEGEVIIQTKNQDFFEYYLKADYKEFLEEELKFREDLYPPHIRMARIIFSHKNGIKVKNELHMYIKDLKKNQDLEVVGFGECLIFKLANKYRYEIIIRSQNLKSMLQVLHGIKSPMVTIDMDTNY